MYIYASGLVIMPVYFLLTLAVIRRHQGDASARALRAAVTGFVLAFLPLALWYVLHPERATQLVLNYTHGEYNKGLGLKGFVGAAAISHLDAWWDCYNPDKLFFPGTPTCDSRPERQATFCWWPVCPLWPGSGPRNSTGPSCGLAS